MATPLAAKLMTLGTTWRYSNGDLHAGYDYPVNVGTIARAVRDGTVLAVHDGVQNNARGVTGVSGAPVNFVLLGITYKGMRIDNKRIDEGDVFHLCDYELRFTYRTD